MSGFTRQSLNLMDRPGIIRRTGWKSGRVGGHGRAGRAEGVKRVIVGGNRNLYSWSSGSYGDWDFKFKGFSSSDEARLYEALELLYEEINQDIAGRAVGENYLDRHERKNCTQPCPHSKGSNGRAWGGYNTGTPSVLVDRTFRRGKLKFKLVTSSRTIIASSRDDCRIPAGGCFVCTDAGGNMLSIAHGYIKNWDRGDSPDRGVKIYLCADLIRTWYSPADVASTIAHEVLHGLGADEKAAHEMDHERADFDGGCDDATCAR